MDCQGSDSAGEPTPANLPDDGQRQTTPVCESAWLEAFPFLLAWDDHGILTQVGPGMVKGCPDVAVGRAFADLFTIEHPLPGMPVIQASRHASLRFSFRHRTRELSFRAQWMPGKQPGEGCFLVTPCLVSRDQAEAIGLTESDFPPHDATPDLLDLVMRRQSAVSELELLAESLRVERERLRHANERLCEQEQEARKLALVAARTDNAVVLTNPTGEIEWVNEGLGIPLRRCSVANPVPFCRAPKPMPPRWISSAPDWQRKKVSARKFSTTARMEHPIGFTWKSSPCEMRRGILPGIWPLSAMYPAVAPKNGGAAFSMQHPRSSPRRVL
jgi:hypothetical protein